MITILPFMYQGSCKYVNAEGLAEDITPLSYDMENISMVMNDEIIDIFGIASIGVWDEAGNKAFQSILPGYLVSEENENRVGLNVIPEHLRLVIEGNNIHEHIYSTEWIEDIAPTCGRPGSKSHHCTVPACDSKSDITEIPATGEHVYGEWVTTSYASFGSEGEKERVCTVCGMKETEAIPRIEHKPCTEATITDEETTTSEMKYEKGTEFAKGNNEYKIISKKNKKGKVAYTGSAKKSKKVKVPKTVKVDGVTYIVTEIAANAFKGDTKLTSVTIPEGVTKIGKSTFYGCKNLKTITIKSSVLKSVGKNAIKNINKKAIIKVPKKKLKSYKKLFKSKTGYKQTMKIRK